MSSHNVWSGGEYSNNLDGIIVINMEGTVSPDWYVNGNYSFKFISTSELSNFQINILYNKVGENLTISFDCLNTEYSFVAKVYQLSGSTLLNSQTLSVPTSNNLQTVTMTTTTLDTVTVIRLLIESSNLNHTIFADNIKIM